MKERHAEKIFPMSLRWTNKLTDELKKLLGKFAGDESDIARRADLLLAKYSEKHRVYHDLSHIENLLRTAEIFKDRIEDYESLQLAVWFHDAIYEPQSKTNETDSARLAVESLIGLNFPKAIVEKVEKMILATQKHDASGSDADGKLFLDLDLGILGARREIYLKYARAIRKEYSFVPEKLYREKRREILEAFLRREFIYYTAEMREGCEESARGNIANEIKELS